MKAQLKVQLGNKMLILEGEGNAEQIIQGLGFFSTWPTKCSQCGSDNIGMRHKNAKGYDFYGLICNECTATLSFGQLKTGGFYIKGDWEKYFSKSSANNTSANNSEPPAWDGPAPTDKDLPF